MHTRDPRVHKYVKLLEPVHVRPSALLYKVVCLKQKLIKLETPSIINKVEVQYPDNNAATNAYF